ncbi:tRNA (adenosine(37)-N6)-dimethylallyltransferase MiaA [Pedobacter sandarakinus]|uniref:tRNA (adenosine(37)-N6)-dimethylallyltransferase MiaA n=1 Tax=Pedobacter sandarakinus TaxID=353156 RepID=UPI002246A6DF|nr:tRNA (adenosine(37)-N6)-dimethylallyltransferase MiaA [Pedobacter sandarakinus]MCX2574207.1 tRNA (adenosine(37)-N6)-dimethylallyltransferase MiaA [Pedobacter sandarakinus]
MSKFNLIVILGATASGKTKLAVEVADVLNGEIISADSRQIFKHMDIGTGKDLSEYQLKTNKVPYHLIDILNPGERYHVDAFKNDFFTAYESIISRNKVPILCGGTGMYIHSLLQNQEYTAVPVNPDLRASLIEKDREDLLVELANFPQKNTSHADISSKKRLIRAIEIATYLEHHELKEVQRPDLIPLIFGLKSEVQHTRTKIWTRLESRLANGMIKEVENLLKMGVAKESLIFYGLEYKFIISYLDNVITYDELRANLFTAICQFAKRQNTFFRKMEKDGVVINWLNASLNTNLLKQQLLQKVL